MEPCPICEQDMQYHSLGTRDAYSVDCPRCGNYHLTRTALANLRNTNLTTRQKANISGWLIENRPFEINSSNIDWLANLSTPSFHERADKLLLMLDKRTEFIGNFIGKEKLWLSYGWCANREELSELLTYLETLSRIYRLPAEGESQYKVLANGWSHLESIKEKGAESKQGFVAMWFDDKMQTVYDEAIALGILDAGYKPHRVDQREYNDKIDDEIIAQLRRSRFVVADFTGHRGGVYYEAGFAKGLGLEVFWTCRKDDINNLHFDIRQYNCISWQEDDLQDYREKLSFRIERVLGRGKYLP